MQRLFLRLYLMIYLAHLCNSRYALLIFVHLPVHVLQEVDHTILICMVDIVRFLLERNYLRVSPVQIPISNHCQSPWYLLYNIYQYNGVTEVILP